MDAFLFLILAVVVAFMEMQKPEVKKTVVNETAVEDTNRVAKLNDSFYEEPNAFSEIINALGFPKE